MVPIPLIFRVLNGANGRADEAAGLTDPHPVNTSLIIFCGAGGTAACPAIERSDRAQGVEGRCGQEGVGISR